jgi:hypothetical protein
MEFQKHNSLTRVSFTGGMVGLLAGSQLGRLERVISLKNADGWNLAEVVPENRNLIIWVFRLVLLVVTLGLWTLSTGYILVFERPSAVVADNRMAKPMLPQGRREPIFEAKRTST